MHAGHEVITAAGMIDARALLAANNFDMAIVNRKLKENNDQKESCDIRDMASKSPLQLKRY